MLSFLLLTLFTQPAQAGALEDAINAKVTSDTVFCSGTALHGLSIACDGEDVYQGDGRLSLAMKLLIKKGFKPISCNYSRGGQNTTDSIFCALSR
jgi:hypothetical protein